MRLGLFAFLSIVGLTILACDSAPTASQIDDDLATASPAGTTSVTNDSWLKFGEDVFDVQVRPGWNPVVLHPAAMARPIPTPASNLPAGYWENALKSFQTNGIDPVLVVLIDSPTKGQIIVTPCLARSLTGSDTLELFRGYQQLGIATEMYGQLQVFGENFDVVRSRALANYTSYQAIAHEDDCYLIVSLNAETDDEGLLADFKEFTRSLALSR